MHILRTIGQRRLGRLSALPLSPSGRSGNNLRLRQKASCRNCAELERTWQRSWRRLGGSTKLTCSLSRRCGRQLRLLWTITPLGVPPPPTIGLSKLRHMKSCIAATNSVRVRATAATHTLTESQSSLDCPSIQDTRCPLFCPLCRLEFNLGASVVRGLLLKKKSVCESRLQSSENCLLPLPHHWAITCTMPKSGLVSAVGSNPVCVPSVITISSQSSNLSLQLKTDKCRLLISSK
eukprot:SAG31_NODE_46_length_30980_cov_226.095107_16_plen_235_part_00